MCVHSCEVGPVPSGSVAFYVIHRCLCRDTYEISVYVVLKFELV